MRILFLTNNANTEKLIEELKKSEEVYCYQKKLVKEDIQKIIPDFIISYNYKYLITKDIIDMFKGRIINLHTSLLPWNKGSYPNLWSFIDNTPKGVTIHEVSEKIDEGKIIIQKKVEFNEETDTLISSYNRLQDDIQKLLLDNWEEIKKGKIIPRQAIDEGTKHTIKETEKYLNDIKDWNITIKDFRKMIKEMPRTFIIAEISANHQNDKEKAKKIIEAAANSGADAVKLQTYTPDTITLDCDNKYFQMNNGTIWDGRTLYDLYQEAYTPWEWHKELMDYAKSLNLICFSSPFDLTAVDFLETLEVPYYKIASFEINDIRLIEYTASKGKPMIISTGVATEKDIWEAIEACKRSGNHEITLLKCVSAYPTPLEEVNLRMISDMQERFSVPIGLSDHTLGGTVAVAAVALGAKVIEKHITLSRSDGGVDSQFSMEPEEFKNMVKEIRNVERALGKISYELSPKQLISSKYRRSIFVSKNVKAGERVTEENIKSVRPSDGLATKHWEEVIGKTFRCDTNKGTPLSWELLE